MPGQTSEMPPIRLWGVRQNNLKNFNLEVPTGKLVVVTGPSGSGKSSLAFDSLFAEGQRRYVETFSPYARQFFDRMDKPAVDRIENIPPAIAVEQRNSVKTTRSTVGSMTEIADYMKQAWPMMATLHCKSCCNPVHRDASASIWSQLSRPGPNAHSTPTPAVALVSFELPLSPKMSLAEELDMLVKQGYQRLLVGTMVRRVDEALPVLEKVRPTTLSVVQDRITILAANRPRFIEACEQAFHFGKGRLQIHRHDADPSTSTDSDEVTLHFSSRLHCAPCNIEYKEPTPGLFHFNHPSGACPSCKGFGRIITIDYNLAVPDRSKTLAQGVVKPWLTGHGLESQGDLLKFCKKRGVPTQIPFQALPPQTQQWVLDGDPNYGSDPGHEWPKAWYGVKGYFRWLESKSYKMHVRVLLSRYRSYVVCLSCNGARFQPESLQYKMPTQNGGVIDIALFYKLPVDQALAIIESKVPDQRESPHDPLRLVLNEVVSRLRYLVEVGLGYLTLDRSTRTLSGGETERVSLTACLGARLVNTLFVLDEPSVGLHHRDTRRLIGILKRLRDAGNTVVVVEHDPEIIRSADHIVDIGPASGEQGGYLMFSGPPHDLASAEHTSATAHHLAKLAVSKTGVLRDMPLPSLSTTDRVQLVLTGASANNLKDLIVRIPLQQFVGITGVSGSGKTTLVRDVLFPLLKEHLNSRQQNAKKDFEERTSDASEDLSTPSFLSAPRPSATLAGWESLQHVLLVDQSSLGKTPRSNPALYVGAFDSIRKVFALSQEARHQGLSESSFSFNSPYGQCERCRGAGFEQIEMQFLSDVYIRCPECAGKRYRNHVLKVRIKPAPRTDTTIPQLGDKEGGANIADLLESTIDDAIAWLLAVQTGKKRCPAANAASLLGLLRRVGLGYLRLGQPINTLSGGECQRLKLVSHMATLTLLPEPEPTLFIFDEPTTGLHMRDVENLLETFRDLIRSGHSIIVIEHNLEVIRSADWVIDLGPEGGTQGGELVAEGTPLAISLNPRSRTGQALIESTPAHSPGSAGVSYGNAPHTNAFVFEEKPASTTKISIRGAREHNLKIPVLDIPRDKFVVLTGVSGSGKSTLAFDLLFAEGQRRFLDSMSAYARQFVDQMSRPDVDLIAGIPPTVSIEQRLSRGGGKSTVATVTEIHHFLRLLYARLGTQYCPECNQPVEAQTRDTLTRALVEQTRDRGDLLLLAPVVRGRKGFHSDVGVWAAKHGFKEIRADGKIYPTKAPVRLDRFKEHNVEIITGVIDKPRSKQKQTDAEMRALVETTLQIGQGSVIALDNHGKTSLHSTQRACGGCGRSFGELDPKSFSYNSPQGWCMGCRGFGELFYLPDVDRGARADAIEESWFGWQEGKREACPECQGARLNPVARAVHLDLDKEPQLGARKSTGKPGPTIDVLGRLSVAQAAAYFNELQTTGRAGLIMRDIIPEIRERLRFLSEVGLGYLQLDRGVPTLSGGESQRIRLAAQLGSNLSGVLYVLDEPTIGLHPRDNDRLLDTLQKLQKRGNSLLVVEHDDQTMKRADHIIDLGPGAGIHGGRVVAQGTLEELSNNPDSITGACLRETHVDAALIRARPVIRPTNNRKATPGPKIKLKPKLKANLALTLRPAPKPLEPSTQFLDLSNASVNNLKNLDVQIPLARFVAVTGVSGSGKSTMVRQCLVPALKAAIARKRVRPAQATVAGFESIQAVHEVDQSPIGRTPRSTPATYVGFFDAIRDLFSKTPEARLRGYSGSRFSFNSVQGRCPQCAGAGTLKLEMNFLPPAFVKCDTCGGSRYNSETLDICYNGKTIAEVLELSVEEASSFFAAIPKIHRALRALQETGLGYLQLGQRSPTLSGGEAQRIKLVSHLLSGWSQKPEQNAWAKRCFFILEEPTIGLHMSDVRRLLGVIQQLVDAGHTVLVIEHNLDLISAADWVLDLGPEAGEQGGTLVVAGSPAEVCQCSTSHTGHYLKPMLANRA